MAEVAAPVVGSVLRVFGCWNSDGTGCMSRAELSRALSAELALSADELDALMLHIGTGGDHLINADEFTRWLASSHPPHTTGVQGALCCADGHHLAPFAPDLDGWCCEECGEDLAAGQPSLQCAECAGQAFCTLCALRQSDAGFVEAYALDVVREFAESMRADAAAKVAQAAEAALASARAEAAREARVSRDGPLLLTVQDLSGPLCEVEANRTWMVSKLKAVIAGATGVCVEAQTLVADSEALQDDLTLQSIPFGVAADIFLFHRSQEQVAWLQMIRKGEAFRRSGQLLVNAPDEVRSDKLIVTEIVSQRGVELEFASEDLRANPEVVFAALKQNAMAVQYASPELLSDRAFALRLVTTDGHYLQVLSDEMRMDYELVKAAVAHSHLGVALSFAHPAFLESGLDFEIASLAFSQGFKLSVRRHVGFTSSRAVGLAAAECAADQFQHLSSDLRADRWFALKAMETNGCLLQFIAPELWDDSEVVAAAVSGHFTLRGSPKVLRQHHTVVYHCVQRSGMELQYASSALQADRRIVLAAVQQCGLALEFAAVQMRNERKIAEAALKNDRDAYQFIGANLRLGGSLL